MNTCSPGMELKQKNRNAIYRLIHDRVCVSKQNIVNELRLSLPTVTQNLVELMEEGLVREQGSFGNTGGRRARGYAIVPEARVAVGVDMNKSHCSVVLIDLQGQVLAHEREYKAFENSEAYYREMAAMVARLVKEKEIKPKQILGAGLAIQGITTADHAQISYGEILSITGERIERIGSQLPYPKALFHDSDMAAYAEKWYQNSDERTVYLSLSTNLGGAIMGGAGMQFDGNFGLGRLEHMTIVPDGKRCYCGQFGCADAYCATTVLTDVTEDGRLISFFRELEAGQEAASVVWEDYLSKLAIVLNNACMMFDCPVVLGGYLAEYLEPYMEELKRRAYRRNSFDQNRDYLRLAHIRQEPVAIGAALQYIERFLESV